MEHIAQINGHLIRLRPVDHQLDLPILTPGQIVSLFVVFQVPILRFIVAAQNTETAVRMPQSNGRSIPV